MVICNIDVSRVPSKTKAMGDPPSSSKKGFRLQEVHQDNSETGSIYSVYKQKIDSMFESDSSHGNETNVKNCVQARIEKMFVEVAKDEGLLNGLSENAVTVAHGFSVDYLGSVQLVDKVTNLAGLQQPLKKLYFDYKTETSSNRNQQKPMTERLEISPIGLKIQYRSDKGEMEQLNPFPTIAVWSAVKFVVQKKSEFSSCAFLPLITDPDNLDKRKLFFQLNQSEIDVFHKNKDSHAPLFAVVMRTNDGLRQQRRLECHGFACQTSEDAIVMAATLYKSLMAHMEKARQGRRPKTTREGLSCMSTTSSVLEWNGDVATPVRPPRKKRSNATSSINSDREQTIDVDDRRPLLTAKEPSLHAKKNGKTRRAPSKPEDLDAIKPYEEVTKNVKHSYENAPINKEKNNEGNGRSVVVVSKSQNLRSGTDGDNQGDILTKVTIPRSGSFLNAGGLTRYKSKINRANGQSSGGSPLGFHELFNEFRLQEGLHSIDDILGVIIDAEGMSFNDLKPIYKEFLLKLALTLTKDELFQRSKAIMKKQKKKSLRTKSPLYRQKKTSIVSSKLKTIQKIFSKKLKSKLKPKMKSRKINNYARNSRRETGNKNESTISTSSYDTRQFRPKEKSIPVVRKPSYKKKTNIGIRNYKDYGTPESKNWKDRISTSEESDFFSLQRGRDRVHTNPNGSGSNPNRNSSSGYVSCSECSYDSDTCTCRSADKCYCSLGQRNLSDKPRKTSTYASCKKCRLRIDEKCYCSWKPSEGASTLTFCGCDTDSCSESNKCYCKKGEWHKPTTVVDPKYVEIHGNLCKKKLNSKPSRDVEYVRESSEKYYEKLRSKVMKHYENDVLPSRRRSQGSSDIWSDKNDVNYYRKSNETCRAPSIRSFQSATKYVTSRQSGKTVCSTSVSSGGCTEALSVKKSAEIAALFADVKLSQTTDITHLIPPRDYENSYKISSSKKKPSKRRIGSSVPTPPIPLIDATIMNNPVYVSQKIDKNKMYSTRNGLYTIPSQSDESRRSSVSESCRKESRNVEERYKGRNVSSNLENSLGYLP